MKQKEEPAEPLLTRKAEEETSLQKDGFLSALYQPDKDSYPGKALILVGGSDGYWSLTRLIAEQYVARGMTVLALAYWNREGLPTALSHIPLEYVEKAGQWLKAKGYEKIGIMGVSMGAEYALLCAACLPEYISCCVAINPISICTQGLQKKNAWHRRMKLLEGAAFSFRGKDLPFENLRFHKPTILQDSLKRKEICILSCYSQAVAEPKKEAWIPVEKIRGPVLLLAAEQDAMWPSAESAEQILMRRNQADLETEYFCYAYASHLLLPYKLKSRKMFRLERKFPEECWNSNMDAFRKTLLFLGDSW